MSENNITITNNNTVNVPRQSRGAGTVLMVIFFGWALVFIWWPILAALWIVWMIIAGIVSIFEHDFFANNWYQPWPAWMFGIR
jgi:hypothetical protein